MLPAGSFRVHLESSKNYRKLSKLLQIMPIFNIGDGNIDYSAGPPPEALLVPYSSIDPFSPSFMA